MEVKLIEREEIIIGGFSKETTLENNENDLSILLNEFYNGKMELLNNFTKNTIEYYGVIWYTKLHQNYKYLIGQKITNESNNFDIKIIPKGIYAYSSFSKCFDVIRAWTEFYQTGISNIGYKPKEKDDVAFEYYPNGLNNEYELWSLVEKI